MNSPKAPPYRYWFAGVLASLSLIVSLVLIPRAPSPGRGQAASALQVTDTQELPVNPPRSQRPRPVPQDLEPEPDLKAQDRATDPAQLSADLEVFFASSGPRTSEKRVLEQTLRDRFRARDLPQGTSLDELECRSTVCKAKVSSPDLDSYKSAISQVFVDPATAIDTGMTLIFPEQETRPDGSHHATFYLVPPDFLPTAEGG